MIKYRKLKAVNGARPVPRETLTTKEIAREMERETGIPAIRTMCVIEAYAELVVRHLREGDHVVFADLGTFKTCVGMEGGEMVVKRVSLFPSSKAKGMFEDVELREAAD